MSELPFIDEHGQPVAAPAEVVWEALLELLRRRAFGAEGFARFLGCDPAQGTGAFTGRVGETVPGFRIAAVEPPRRLVLRGRHRFASYELTFLLDGDRLCAQTRAEFPDLLGRLYRVMVIGSGGHRVITRHLLRQIARRAERHVSPGTETSPGQAR